MKVIALKPGYFGNLRYPGDEFDVPDGARASWFAPVKTDDKKVRGRVNDKLDDKLDDPLV